MFAERCPIARFSERHSGYISRPVCCRAPRPHFRDRLEDLALAQHLLSDWTDQPVWHTGRTILEFLSTQVSRQNPTACRAPGRHAEDADDYNLSTPLLLRHNPGF
jgi:hypothetical protein